MTRYERQEGSHRINSDWIFGKEIFISDFIATTRDSNSLANEFGYLLLKAVKEICSEIILEINKQYRESWDVRSYDALLYYIVNDKMKIIEQPTIDCRIRKAVTVHLNTQEIYEIRRKLNDYTNFRQSRIRQDFTS